MHITGMRISEDVLSLRQGAGAGFVSLTYYNADEMHAPGAVIPSDGTPTTGLDAAALSFAVLVDFNQLSSLDATTGFETVALTVSVSGQAGSLPIEAGRVLFSDDVGAPPGTVEVAHHTSPSDQTLVYSPAVQAPAVFIITPPCAVPSDFSIQLTGGECATGASVVSIVSLNFNGNDTNAGAAIQGWSFGVCTDDLLEVTGAATDDMDAAAVKNGAAADYSAVVLFPHGVTHGLVIDYMSAVTLLAVNDFTDLAITMTANVTETPPLANIRTCNDTIGTPPMANVMVIDGVSIACSTFDGVLAERATGCCEEALRKQACNLPAEIRYSPGACFIPGSANGDGPLDIADAIRLLDYLFRGGPAQDSVRPNTPSAGS